MLTPFVLPDQLTQADVTALLRHLKQGLSDQGVVLIPGLEPSPPLLQALLQAVRAPEPPDDLLPLLQAGVGARSRPQKALQGMFALPLHRDGALVGKPTSFIAFASQGEGHAEPAAYLEMLHTPRALRELPADIIATLNDHAPEYRVPDRRPFPDLPEGWFTRPVFIGDKAARALSIILPTAPSAPRPAPWEVRISGMSDAASQQFLARLDHELRKTSGFMRHIWRAGDVILLDNSCVLHGAGAVIPGQSAATVRASV